MEQSLMDKLTILADSAKYDVACTSSGASHPAKRGTIAGLLPRLYRRWPLRQPAESPDEQLLRLRLQLLRQSEVQRRSPGHFFTPGAGRTDHRVLPPQLHRGTFPVQRCAGDPRLHHRADAHRSAAAAERISLRRLHPCQDHPRHQPRAHPADGLPRRPPQRQRRAAQRAEPPSSRPRQRPPLHLPAHEADLGGR